MVVCAAGPATDVATLVQAAREAAWTVNVLATPAALSFLDLPSLEDLSGFPIRAQARDPATPRDKAVPTTTAILIAPATFNTINKLAAGIADNYALTIVAEAIGKGTPTVVVPFVNAALASRLAYRQSLNMLREEKVQIIEGNDDNWLPHPPGTGDQQQSKFPWLQALTAITR